CKPLRKRPFIAPICLICHDGRPRADANPPRRGAALLGSDVGANPSDAGIHQPHAAARSAREVATRLVRDARPAPPRDHPASPWRREAFAGCSSPTMAHSEYPWAHRWRRARRHRTHADMSAWVDVHIGPELAVQLGVEAGVLVVALEAGGGVGAVFTLAKLDKLINR